MAGHVPFCVFSFFLGGVLGHGLRETKCWHFGLVLAFGTCEF